MRLDWVARLPPDGPPEFAGALPAMASAAGVTVAIDGRLFDQADGPEVVLDGFLREGASLFPRLRGRFSLLVWDGREQVLHALRDPTGMGTLFHARAGDDLVLGPSTDALLGVPGVDRSIDPLYVAGQLILTFTGHPEETIFASIRRVPAGRRLLVSAGRAQALEYWSPFADAGLPDDPDERFGELLDQALRRCGRRPAIFLSGGIDSALLATASARVSSEPPVAISILNPTPEADESATQHAVARELGIDILAVSPWDAVPRGELLVRSLEVSSRSSWPAGTLQSVGDVLVSRAAELGCDVLLTGDGGDEWLMPFPSLAAERVARLDARTLTTMVQAWRYLSHGANDRQMARWLGWRQGLRPLARASLLAVVPPDVRARAHRMTSHRVASRMPDWLLPGRRGDLAQWCLERLPQVAPHRLHAAEKRWLVTMPTTSALMESARSTRERLGIEMVSPLWDADLVAFAASLPPATHIRGGQAKSLARRYMRGRLSFSDRWPLKTFGDSVVDLAMAHEGAAAWHHLGGVRHLAAEGIVDADRLQSLFERGHAEQEPRAWDVLSVEAWLRARL